MTKETGQRLNVIQFPNRVEVATIGNTALKLNRLSVPQSQMADVIDITRPPKTKRNREAQAF